ncbi:hypothetical protein [Actinomadura decatromicini]|uniref:Uncharacterized protein n=1 Tax=Actinomadura decatromicini TaxID=2604572 RepID=A0A5D3FD32_9ACTN|nr:hypothetical protein [Actinomadura decatromicini]TYK45225.1 hypothetical protein FXF68_31605 [Actinomadura decatromicini]
MTLDTTVYVLDRIPHRDVFVKCNQILGATEATLSHDEQLRTWRRGVCKPEPGNAWHIGNDINQGLCALLDVYYRPDMPLRAADNGCEWYCDPGCGDEHSNPACWLEVSFDTTYGYRDEQGRGCGDLHASIVADLGRWLDERGVRWLWQNEFTGEIHSGYERLIDLCTGGFEATAWFQTTVLPAINGGRS